MYGTILVPTDGSRGSSVASDHALELADEHGATVHALHVVSPAAAEGLARPEAAVDGLREHGEELVDRVARRAGKRGIPCETAVREGAPAGTIREYADEVGADVVVMGTHGRTGIQRYLLGSVAERVVRSSSVPVLTLSPDAVPEVTDPEAAVAVARDALEREGQTGIDVPERPSRGASTWVVRAETDGGTFNVHVGTDGTAHVARIPDREG
jgi:nucleotide-binding universal stress UspA family protein